MSERRQEEMGRLLHSLPVSQIGGYVQNDLATEASPVRDPDARSNDALVQGAPLPEGHSVPEDRADKARTAHKLHPIAHECSRREGISSQLQALSCPGKRH